MFLYIIYLYIFIYNIFMLKFHREVLNILSNIGGCVCIYEGYTIAACVSERILYQVKLYFGDVLESSSSMKKTA